MHSWGFLFNECSSRLFWSATPKPGVVNIHLCCLLKTVVQLWLPHSIQTIQCAGRSFFQWRQLLELWGTHLSLGPLIHMHSFFYLPLSRHVPQFWGESKSKKRNDLIWLCLYFVVKADVSQITRHLFTHWNDYTIIGICIFKKDHFEKMIYKLISGKSCNNVNKRAFPPPTIFRVSPATEKAIHKIFHHWCLPDILSTRGFKSCFISGGFFQVSPKLFYFASVHQSQANKQTL